MPVEGMTGITSRASPPAYSPKARFPFNRFPAAAPSLFRLATWIRSGPSGNSNVSTGTIITEGNSDVDVHNP
jgi:hypothetical protein